MKLFTVVDEHQRTIIERLIDLARKPLKERRGLIKSLERDGYTIEFIGGRYQARSEGTIYKIPLKRCPSCKSRKPLDAFLTLRDVEHPWCQSCRHGNPEGAERARAERDHLVEKGTYDPLANQRCQNPACPNGGLIPAEKLKYDPSFCSRHCWEVATCGERRICQCGKAISTKITGDYCSRDCQQKYTRKQCDNPECDATVAPQRKYCSRDCMVIVLQKQGHYKAAGEKGIESQFVYMKEHGEVPGYAQRSRAVAQSNRDHPRRARQAPDRFV